MCDPGSRTRSFLFENDVFVDTIAECSFGSYATVICAAFQVQALENQSLCGRGTFRPNNLNPKHT